MKKFSAAILVLCSLTVISCRQTVNNERPAVKFVSDILNDPQSEGYKLLSSHDEPLLDGTITIIGSPEQTSKLSDAFVSFDSHDNVSGRIHTDFIPDFAGETICCISDSVASPYYVFACRYGDDSLRNHLSRLVVDAIDTTYSLSKYDIECLGTKKTSKIIVIADPKAAAECSHDIDTLFAGTGCNIPVIFPFKAMIDRLPAKKNIRIGILCDLEYYEEGIYDKLISDQPSGRNISFKLFAAEPDCNPLLSFLDASLSNDATDVFDALLVDCSSIDFDIIQSTLAKIKDINRPESMKYGRMLSADFIILDSCHETLNECFNLMRKKNIFTHFIAYPKSVGYHTYFNPVTEGQNILLLSNQEDH